MAKANKLIMNDAGFTGLEAAIVLIAFVVVAAVFSYVMLGAGFFTSQTSNAVVHTGVDMATSSVQTSGQVIAVGDTDNNCVESINVTLQLTAGNSPIDLSKTIISFQDSNQSVTTAWDGSTMSSAGVMSTTGTAGDPGITWIHQTDKNTLLEPGELAIIQIPVSNGGTAVTGFSDLVYPNDQVTLTVIPPQGATLPITVTVPPAIEKSMALY